MNELYLNNYGYYNHDHKLIWIKIPKCASTSIAIALNKINFFKYCPYDNSYQNPLSPEKADKLNYNKFCFVRNPWDRFVSAYINRFLIHKKYGKEFDSVKNKTFKNILKRTCKLSDEKLECHFRSQSYYLKYNNKIIVNDIKKFENIEEDWEKLIKKYNFPKLEHHKKTNHFPYRKYYNKETQKMIFDRYQEDIINFNYNYEIKFL